MIDAARLLAWRFPPIRQTLTRKDCILYALGVGLGGDPLDERQLRFLYEEGLAALPTMAAVLAYPGFWIKDPATGIDWRRVVHGEQRLVIHRPLPVEGELIGRSRITGLVDKGPGKGALLYTERVIADAAGGAPYASLEQSTFCRGEGGFGGAAGPTWPVHALPARPPDQICDLPSLPQQALLYRLSGDDNPLHVDPATARAAGFERPILHGLCTLGIAGHALLATCCGYNPARFRSLALRFSAPLYPGETIRTEMWREDGHIAFRARSRERDVVVLDGGRFEMA